LEVGAWNFSFCLTVTHPVAGNFRFPPASAILVMFFCDVFLLHSG
jgi:hypothetical protein